MADPTLRETGGPVTERIDAPSGPWSLRAAIRPGAPEGPVLRVASGGVPVASLGLRGEAVTAEVRTVWRKPGGEAAEHTIRLEAPSASRELILEWLGPSVQLWADGVLADEDWPLGEPEGGEWTVAAYGSARDHSIGEARWESTAGDRPLDGPIQFYVPEGQNTGVGDCMPFDDGGRFRLFYLYDRRAHGSKFGLGAHQWAQVSTADLKSWTVHPLAVPITEQWEGSICTGSLLHAGNLTYAFYSVRMSDGSPARLTWSISRDGVRFEKSGAHFTLHEPYDPVSARDPMVFRDEKGLYHMLVTKSLPSLGRYGGCLAHATSLDLCKWTQRDPFLVPGYSDQPECSDHFKWNGWYYLVFSNNAAARYRMSRHPLGPWSKPSCDLLDAPQISVPKTASFGKRRLTAGFLRRGRYAGCAVLHEIFQRTDGTLGVKFALEVLPPSTGHLAFVSQMEISSPQGRSERPFADHPGCFRLRTRLQPSDPNMLFGIALEYPDDGSPACRLEFDAASGILSLLEPGEHFHGDPRGQLTSLCEMGNGFGIDLLVKGDVLDLAVSTGRILTMRLERDCRQIKRLSLYAQWGTLSVEDLRLDRIG